MRPKYGNLLSPERWNPRQDIFYQELVIVSDPFRRGLEKYLATPKGNRIPYHVLKDKSGLKIKALRSLASGKTPYAPRDSYHSIASTLELDVGVDPSKIRVRGAYIGMPAAYYFDHKGKNMEAAKEIMRGELAKADPEIARRLNKGDEESKKREYNAVNCTIGDVLTGRGGILPLTVIIPYEHEVIKIFGVDEIIREDLIGTFPGDIKTLEDRIDQLINNKMKQNPQKYVNVVSVNGYSIVVAHQLPTFKRSYGGGDKVYEDLHTCAPEGWEERFLKAQQKLHSNKPLDDILRYLPEHSVVSYIGNPEIPTKIGVPENVSDLHRVRGVVKRWLELKTTSSHATQHTN